MKTKTDLVQPAEFIIPKETTSWHFERTLKPDDRKVDNYVLIQPGAPDVIKVLQAYTHHPVSDYNIASIEIVYNEPLNRQFFNNMQIMNKHKGNPKRVPTWRTTTTGIEKTWREATYHKLQTLSASYSDPRVPNVMLLPLWHGTNDTVSGYIFNEGYGIFNSNDPNVVTDEGYFGRGVYTAHEAEYAFRSYAERHGDKAVLLLNWVSIYEAYPVIDGDMDKLKGKSPGYDQCDAHFVPVVPYDLDNPNHFNPSKDSYYPTRPNEDHKYTELVVFSYQQCLPRYRVKLIQNAPQPPLDDMASLYYQNALDSLSLGQYEHGANAFENAATAGHPGASMRLHWLYSGGSGIIAADSQALQNYQTLPTSSVSALKQKANFRGGNDQESQFTLAWCYQHGLGCEINLVNATQYYWIAAMQGHREAQYQLGVCCASGIGVKPDIKQAIVYFEQAAAQGHVHAHYVLFHCYEFGLGIQANPTKALEHKQAAKKGKHPLLAGLPTVNPVNISPNVQLEQENKQLKQQLGQLEKDLAEYKEREAALKKEFEMYKTTLQSPVPISQSQANPFSPFFSPDVTDKPAVLNPQQQIKQNQLVAACLKGNLESVEALESQYALFSYPNQEGLYPLVAAVYGCSLETVRYVESKLKDEAEKQWSQVDVNKAKAQLDRWTPAELSKDATYGELGNWYAKYEGASWCNYYDIECLKRSGNKGKWYTYIFSRSPVAWGEDKAWEIGGKNLWGYASARVRYHLGRSSIIESENKIDNCPKTSSITCLVPDAVPFGTSSSSTYSTVLVSPIMSDHEDVVKTIREQMKELRNKVETKVQCSSAAVFNPKV